MFFGLMVTLTLLTHKFCPSKTGFSNHKKFTLLHLPTKRSTNLNENVCLLAFFSVKIMGLTGRRRKTSEGDFGRYCFHFYLRGVLAEVRACAARDGAIRTKNGKIQIMGTISSLKMLLCYALRLRLRFLLWVNCKGYVLVNPAVLLVFLLTQTSTWTKPNILETLN